MWNSFHGKKQMSSIRLFFAGDFCSKPSTSIITISDELKNLIQSCDLKLVNFEAPLKPDVKQPTQKRERFFQNDDAPAFLRSLGFNLFSLANNHAFDWGNEGFLKVKSVLGDNAFGAGTYDEAYRIKVVEVRGVKVGFMALSFAAYKGAFDDVTEHEGLGCAYINDLRVNHDIIEAKKHVDYLFVLPHDGIEYIDVPTPEAIARYRDFIDYGADGVIAAHPHCPQGWEEYKSKPIFYSLGNFLFNSKENYNFHCNKPHWYDGICVVVTIIDGKLSCEVVNTKNVDNIGIEIDHSEDRCRYNEELCRYLSDCEEYNKRFKKHCEYRRKSAMRVFEKSVLNHLLNKIRKKDSSDDNELVYLLKNDQRRSFVIRTIC